MDMSYKDLPEIPNDGSQKKIKQSVIKKLEDDILLYELVNQDCSYYSGLIERLKIELIELKEKSKSRRPSSSKSKSRRPSSSKSKSGLPSLKKNFYFKEGREVGLPKIIETREYDGTQAKKKMKGGAIGDDEAGVSPDEAGVSPDEAGVSPDDVVVEEPQQSLCTDNCTDRSCNSEYINLFIFLWRFYVARAPTIDTDIWFDFLINPNSVINDETFTYSMYHDYTGGRTARYVVKLRIRIDSDGLRIIKIIYSILIEYNNEIHLSYFYNYYPNRPAHCKPANVCAIHFTFNSDKTRRLDYRYDFISNNYYKSEELNFRKSLILFALFAYKLAGYINDNESLSGFSYDKFSPVIKDWLHTIETHPISGRRSIKIIVGITRFLCAITIGILNYLNSIPSALDDDIDKNYIKDLNKVYQLDASLIRNPHLGGSAAYCHASHFPLRSVCGNKLQSDKITNYNNKIAKLKEDIKELRKNKKLNKIDKKKELIEKLKLNIKKEKEKLKLKKEKEKLKLKKEKEKLKKTRKK
jgi:hypothetical protein